LGKLSVLFVLATLLGDQNEFILNAFDFVRLAFILLFDVLQLARQCVNLMIELINTVVFVLCLILHLLELQNEVFGFALKVVPVFGHLHDTNLLDGDFFFQICHQLLRFVKSVFLLLQLVFKNFYLFVFR